MALRTNSAEGQSTGTTLSAANSGGGSGTAFNTVSGTGAAASLTFSSVSPAPLKGTMAYKLVAEANLSRWVEWTGYNTTQLVVRMYVRFVSTVPNDTAGHRLIDVHNAANTFSHYRALVLSTGQLSFRSNNGATILKDFTTVLQPDTTYRIEMAVESGTGSQTRKCDLYLGDSTSPIETGYNTAGTSGSTDNIDAVRFIKGGGNPWAGTMIVDDLAAQDATLTYLGPSASSAGASPAAMTLTHIMAGPTVETHTVRSGPDMALAIVMHPPTVSGAPVPVDIDAVGSINAPVFVGSIDSPVLVGAIESTD